MDGMFLRSPAPGQPPGGEPPRPCCAGEGQSVLLCQAQQGRGLLLRPRLGGGLDPGGARAPSRQRRTSPLPTGRTPVRRDARALFPAADGLRSGSSVPGQASSQICDVGAGSAGSNILFDRRACPLPDCSPAEAGTLSELPIRRTAGPLGRVAVIIPTYNERENLESIAARVRGAVPDGRPAGRRRQQPGRHRRARRQARRGRPADPRAAPAGQGRPRRRLHRRLRLGAGARLQRDGRDGRRRLAPARGPAPAAHRAGGRRPGDRLALGARRHGAELAEVAGGAVPRRQHLRPADARHRGPRRHRRVPRLPRARPCARSAWTRWIAGILLPDRPHAAHGQRGTDRDRGADHVQRARPAARAR